MVDSALKGKTKATEAPVLEAGHAIPIESVGMTGTRRRVLVKA